MVIKKCTKSFFNSFLDFWILLSIFFVSLLYQAQEEEAQEEDDSEEEVEEEEPVSDDDLINLAQIFNLRFFIGFLAQQPQKPHPKNAPPPDSLLDCSLAPKSRPSFPLISCFPTPQNAHSPQLIT